MTWGWFVKWKAWFGVPIMQYYMPTPVCPYCSGDLELKEEWDGGCNMMKCQSCESPVLISREGCMGEPEPDEEYV